MAISELLLNPIVYYYLKAPEKENVLGRDKGLFQRYQRCADLDRHPRNAKLIIAFWVIAFLISLTQIRHLTFGDPTASTPLLREDSPYNLSHLEIQKYFGGIEPLIIVVEGRDKDVLKDPSILRTMEKFQRHLERDPDHRVQFLLWRISSVDQHDLL